MTDSTEVLRALQKRIGEGNAAKGFHERGARLRREELADYYTARLALITTEVAEAIEELRNGRAVDETYYLEGERYSREEDELSWYSATGDRPVYITQNKPEGVPSELADIVIRTFDFAHEAGIDLAAMIEEKLTYNSTRPAMHGRKF